MILGRVVGNVVASQKHTDFIGHKVLIIQPLDENKQEINTSFLALDAVQAGKGDIILAAREGNTARQILENDKAPFHSVVLAIVDAISK